MIPFKLRMMMSTSGIVNISGPPNTSKEHIHLVILYIPMHCPVVLKIKEREQTTDWQYYKTS